MTTVDERQQANGHAIPPVEEPGRVRFGPGKTQTMPAEWAEAMLSAWRERDPKRFGEALAGAAIEAS
jgi:hypothetical protein